MLWPGYLPDEFEYLRVVDYLVGGERGGRGGRGKEQQKTPLLFNFQTTSPSLSPFPQARTKKKRRTTTFCVRQKKSCQLFKNIFLQDSLTHGKNRIEFYQSRVFIAQYQEAITEKSPGST